MLQRLDNEASDDLVASITEKQMKYQLAAPYSHRLNPAERAIQSFKNHLISNLHGTNQEFPMYQWDQIIEQCKMTLNMLRRSRINPKLSAYMQMFGAFDYNARRYHRSEQKHSFTNDQNNVVRLPIMVKLLL